MCMKSLLYMIVLAYDYRYPTLASVPGSLRCVVIDSLRQYIARSLKANIHYATFHETSCMQLVSMQLPTTRNLLVACNKGSK